MLISSMVLPQNQSTSPIVVFPLGSPTVAHAANPCHGVGTILPSAVSVVQTSRLRPLGLAGPTHKCADSQRQGNQ
jgi:hypothetical protein